MLRLPSGGETHVIEETARRRRSRQKSRLVYSPVALAKSADSYERRKIVSIMKNGILEEHADEIEGHARQIGVDVTFSGGRLVLPEDKPARKLLLGFLDEDVYRGTARL